MSIEGYRNIISKTWGDGKRIVGINPNNEFLFILENLVNTGIPTTKKALGHKLVGLIAAYKPNLAFQKFVFTTEDITAIEKQLTDFLCLNDGSSIGISTCYQSTMKGMEKAPFWYGRRGGVIDETTFNRFLNGENEESGYWDISDDERKKYPWLKVGYVKTLQQEDYPIVESIVTLHPPGYDMDRKNHFVGRIWNDGLEMNMEIKLGTTLLRDLNEETSPHERIDLILAHGKMRIGSSYIMDEVLDKEIFVRLLTVATKIASKRMYDLNDIQAIIISIYQYIRENKIPYSANYLQAILKYFILGMTMGKNIIKNGNNTDDIDKLVRREGINFLEKIKKNNLDDYNRTISKFVGPKIKSSILSIREAFYPDGSLYMLKDLFDLISLLGFTQIEIIGGIKPDGRNYAMIYEIS